RIEHVDPETDTGLPDVNQVMRGKTVWSLLSYEHDTGAVSATTATLPESRSGEARIATRQLLGRSAGTGRLVVDVSHQMEGYAAARLRAPVDAKGELRPGATMRDVEVAWENYMDGTSGHATIPDAGPFDKADLSAIEEHATLKHALLSVSARS